MPAAKSALPMVALLAAIAALAGCETVPMGGFGPGPAPGPAPFRADDFAWSAREGRASIDGRIDYRRDGQRYECGSVGLTPDTPYTRARFRVLYGSTDRAAIPEAVVRARTVADPNADYRSYVRSSTCQDGRFTFTGLPDGNWFIIAPVSAGGDRVVLMRAVATRGGRVSVTL
ncbi:MAG: hypothetical protein U1C74_11760 [Phenylobacterium sp.]|uniref:hypothetical protein n=1 Tax=Brevundimonas sp. TaxID=1871086 RepID=UPI002737CC32|nr:hypothetical protein [Brevundimonas sp.]MDP3803715.1 hypothetical protein [Brevundimonas sp.]MDZ4372086.1 hypothetical protein [Phenylobacterium sp.]